MSKLKIIKRQVIILFTFAIIISLTSILFGIFFKLSSQEIKKIIIFGVIFTIVIMLPALLILDYIFSKTKLNKPSKLNKLNKTKK